jgi:copper(I)-binding protein
MQGKIKVLFLICALCTFVLGNVSIAQTLYSTEPIVELKPDFVEIKKPYTSSGIAFFKIKNNSDQDLTISGIYSPNARLTKIYEVYHNSIGVEQKKEVKEVNIIALKTTEFSKKTFQVMLAGITERPKSGDELVLEITIKDKGTFRGRFPVVYNFD